MLHHGKAGQVYKPTHPREKFFFFDRTRTQLKRFKLYSLNMAEERTFLMIKPDAVHRGLIGEIITRFEKKGFKLVAMKFAKKSEEHFREHYADLSKKSFFSGLVKYMSESPVVAMVWEGKGVVATARVMLGETNPVDSKPGTIRGDLSIDIGRNIIHGSDSVKGANKEISLWFKDDELVAWKPNNTTWIYE